MECRCPKCGSDQTQPFKLIFESGTSHSQHATTGVGVGSGGLAVGTATSAGVSMTALAQKVAPPEKMTSIGCLPMVAMGACILFGAMIGGDKGGGVGFLIGVVIFFAAIKRMANYNVNIWKPQHDEWLASWMCHRCGHAYKMGKT